MPMRGMSQNSSAIGAQCQFDHGSFPVAISAITPEGCFAEAPADWSEDFEFLHLTIDERVEINGKVRAKDGKRAEIRFFGQIHPQVVKELSRASA